MRDPGPRDVVVRLGASGVCHSDLSIIDGAIPHPLPAVLGHEGAGVVEAVGSAVTYTLWVTNTGIMVDTFSVTVTNTALTYAFADTARAGGIVSFTAYDDANGNGSRDLTEQGLQGIAFSISPGSPKKAIAPEATASKATGCSSTR